MKKEQRLGLRTWIEIDKNAIAHNYSVFRSLISKKTKFLGVVKSNAYGHNLVEFAKELEKLGVDYLAVDSVVEGIALRKEGIKIPILILGYTLPEMLEKAVENDLEITVSNFDYFKEINKLKSNKLVKIHIKTDTGMHRHGFQLGDIKVLSEINKLNNRPRHQNDTPPQLMRGMDRNLWLLLLGCIRTLLPPRTPPFQRIPRLK